MTICSSLSVDQGTVNKERIEELERQTGPSSLDVAFCEGDPFSLSSKPFPEVMTIIFQHSETCKLINGFMTLFLL